MIESNMAKSEALEQSLSSSKAIDIISIPVKEAPKATKESKIIKA